MKAFRIVRPETAFSVSPVKGRRRPRQVDNNHLAFIRGLPCLVCGTRANIEAAHVRMANAIYGKPESGVGKKPDDAWTVPLCAKHHRLDNESQHEIGEQVFWSRHNIDPFGVSLALFKCTGDDEQGEAIVRANIAWKTSQGTP